MSELIEAFAEEGYEVSARLVRHLISEGIMTNPDGGRSNADYGEKHVSQMRRYFLLKDLGWSLASIRSAAQGSGALPPFTIAPGILLVVDPEKLEGPVDAAAIRTITSDILSIVKPATRRHKPTPAKAKEPV